MRIVLSENNKATRKVGTPTAFEFYKTAPNKWQADLVFDNGDRWEEHQSNFKTKKSLLAVLFDLTSSYIHIGTSIRAK